MTLKYNIPGFLTAALMTVGCSSDQVLPHSTASPVTYVQDAQTPGLPSDHPETSGSNGRSNQPVNPSQLRAQATPKTLEKVRGLSGYEDVRSLNPPSFSIEMRHKGESLYQNTCARCHGADGTPHDPKGTLARYNMANLADPLAFKYGADARGVYRSIAYGTAAPPHGTYKGVYSQQEIWSLVAYIETLDRR